MSYWLLPTSVPLRIHRQASPELFWSMLKNANHCFDSGT